MSANSGSAIDLCKAAKAKSAAAIFCNHYQYVSGAFIANSPNYPDSIILQIITEANRITTFQLSIV